MLKRQFFFGTDTAAVAETLERWPGQTHRFQNLSLARNRRYTIPNADALSTSRRGTWELLTCEPHSVPILATAERQAASTQSPRVAWPSGKYGRPPGEGSRGCKKILVNHFRTVNSTWWKLQGIMPCMP
jgi:hypothetical protein